LRTPRTKLPTKAKSNKGNNSLKSYLIETIGTIVIIKEIMMKRKEQNEENIEAMIKCAYNLICEREKLIVGGQKISFFFELMVV
jgi:hypothetical protein